MIGYLLITEIESGRPMWVNPEAIGLIFETAEGVVCTVQGMAVVIEETLDELNERLDLIWQEQDHWH